jgi:hypothetical protein
LLFRLAAGAAALATALISVDNQILINQTLAAGLLCNHSGGPSHLRRRSPGTSSLPTT